MPRIPLESALPGQVVARPITTRAGVVLVQAGAVLTSAMLDGLRRQGIVSVAVVGDEAADEGVNVEARLRDLDDRFRGHEGDPLMMMLKAAVAAQIAGSAPDA